MAQGEVRRLPSFALARWRTASLFPLPLRPPLCCHSCAMSWLHTDFVDDRLGGIGTRFERMGRCIYCNGLMTHFDQIDGYQVDKYRMRRAGKRFLDDDRYVDRCYRCGWWHSYSERQKYSDHIDCFYAYGSLKQLDLADVETPIDEIKSYLAAKFEAWRGLDPIRFESVVASVFRDLRYVARVTARTGDRGIDVYLDGPNDTLVGVQVKATMRAIRVEQINALTGALIINDCTAGVFVTTSRFQPGAVAAAKSATKRGFPITLVDAEALLDALQVIHSAKELDPLDPRMPWNRVDPVLRYSLL